MDDNLSQKQRNLHPLKICTYMVIICKVQVHAVILLIMSRVPRLLLMKSTQDASLSTVNILVYV